MIRLIKNIAATGTLYTSRSADKRNIQIVNYFSIVLAFATFLLLIIRSFLFYVWHNNNIIININSSIIIATFLFLLPLVLNRFGYIRSARICSCWLPSILIIAIYTIDGSKRPGITLTSQFDSIYIYMLGVSAVPYLLLSVTNKKELITGLSVPFFLLLFSDQVMDIFKAGHAYKGIAGDGFELDRMRTFIAYFMLNGCCLIMKTLVEKEIHKNKLLVTELEEKNKWIDEQAEKKLMERDNKYRVLFEQAADAITVVNKDTQFESVNTSACEMFGYTAEEFLLLSSSQIIEEENLKLLPVDLEPFKEQKTFYRERILKRKDGSIFPAEINVRMLSDGGFQSFIRDVTERKKAEQELVEAESKFRNLVERSLTGVYIIKEGKFAYVNPRFAEIFGYIPEELINSYPIETVVHPDDRARVTENVRIRIEGEKDSIHYEAMGQKKNGDIMQMEVFGSKTMYDGKPAIIGTLMDITQNKLLQQQVLDQKIQEQKKITRAVLNAEEKERNRIGQELHDNVNQILVGTKLFLGLAAKDEFAGRGLINRSLELVDSAMEEMRSLSKSQVTPIKGIDLEELIYSLVDKLNAGSSIQTTVLYNIHGQIMEDDLKLNIYRIIQEQINNILKHADASHITISLKDNNGFLCILIEDDGKGFDTSIKRKGIGLSNMINRIESFNGRLEIDSSAGNGTRLKIKVPC